MTVQRWQFEIPEALQAVLKASDLELDVPDVKVDICGAPRNAALEGEASRMPAAVCLFGARLAGLCDRHGLDPEVRKQLVATLSYAEEAEKGEVEEEQEELHSPKRLRAGSEGAERDEEELCRIKFPEELDAQLADILSSMGGVESIKLHLEKMDQRKYEILSMPWCLEMSGNEWPEPSSAAWDFLESLCLLAEDARLISRLELQHKEKLKRRILFPEVDTERVVSEMGLEQILQHFQKKFPGLCFSVEREPWHLSVSGSVKEDWGAMHEEAEDFFCYMLQMDKVMAQEPEEPAPAAEGEAPEEEDAVEVEAAVEEEAAAAEQAAAQGEASAEEEEELEADAEQEDEAAAEAAAAADGEAPAEEEEELPVEAEEADEAAAAAEEQAAADGVAAAEEEEPEVEAGEEKEETLPAAEEQATTSLGEAPAEEEEEPEVEAEEQKAEEEEAAAEEEQAPAAEGEAPAEQEDEPEVEAKEELEAAATLMEAAAEKTSTDAFHEVRPSPKDSKTEPESQKLEEKFTKKSNTLLSDYASSDEDNTEELDPKVMQLVSMETAHPSQEEATAEEREPEKEPEVISSPGAGDPKAESFSMDQNVMKAPPSIPQQAKSKAMPAAIARTTSAPPSIPKQAKSKAMPAAITRTTSAVLPKKPPIQQLPQHDYSRMTDVPQWVQDAENASYAAYARNPPLGHRPREEGWRWRARRTHVLQKAVPPAGLPSEFPEDRALSAPVRKVLLAIRGRAEEEQKTWRKSGPKRDGLPPEVPAHIYVLLQQVREIYRRQHLRLSDIMKKKINIEMWCTVLAVEDMFRDQLFLRKAATEMGVFLPTPMAALLDLTDRRKVVPAKLELRHSSPKQRSERSRSRGRPTETEFPVDEVEFSQDSIGRRFRCGREIRHTVSELLCGEVKPDRDSFMILNAVRVGQRIICRNNRRLWALREFQRLKRRGKSDFQVKVRLRVVQYHDSVFVNFVESRAPRKQEMPREREDHEAEDDARVRAEDALELMLQEQDRAAGAASGAVACGRLGSLCCARACTVRAAPQFGKRRALALNVAVTFIPSLPVTSPNGGRAVRWPRRLMLAMVPAVPAAAEAKGNPFLLLQDGMEAFRQARVEDSVKLFDEAAESGFPKARLWQRGLSLYYAERFADGTEQFRKDVDLNPNDTEESIWAFLCEAKMQGFDQARKQMLTVGQDPRPVMRNAYALFRGDDDGKYLETMENLAQRSGSDCFYASLYLGLFYEAKADSAKAKEWLLKAVDSSYGRSSNDYMADLARVHALRRGWRSEL
ncbi:unnamed protein product [Effrenium voratum]|nr:unnamed protein product [Effrenium voratum]